MQALMLAAGMGKRLGKLTRDRTKCMVEVAGRTLVERALAALLAAGVRRIIMVVGHQAEGLRGFIERRYPTLKVEYIENPDYESTNNIYSLWLARRYLIDDHTLLLESDVIFRDTVITHLLESNAPDMAVVSPFKRWMEGTVATLDCDDNISRIIDRNEFQWEHSGDYYKTVNIYKFSREFSRNYYLPFLEAYIQSFGHNQYYEQVLSVLAKTRASKIKALRIDSDSWYEIDDPHDLSIAETLFTDDAKRYDLLSTQKGGYWRYPHVVDFREPVLPGYPPRDMITELERILPVILTQSPSDSPTQDLLAANYLGIDADLVAAAPGFDALLASIPNHETATLRSRAEVDLDDLPSDGRTSEFFLVDESGLEFLSGQNTSSLLRDEILDAHQELVVVKRISDYHGMHGLNLSIAATADRSLLAEIRRTLRGVHRCSVTEYWLQIAPKYRQQYATACQDYRENCSELNALLGEIPGVCVEASGARHLNVELRLTDPASSLEIARQILSRFNLFVECSADPDRRSERVRIRVACRSTEENLRLSAAVGSVIGRK